MVDLLSVEFRFNYNWCRCVTVGYSVTIGYDNDGNLQLLSRLITHVSVGLTPNLADPSIFPQTIKFLLSTTGYRLSESADVMSQ